MQTIAYIVITAMFTALAFYSGWWLFWSYESVFKTKNMSVDKKENRVYKQQLRTRIVKLEETREEYLAQLSTCFNNELYRKLNIIDQKLEVLRLKLSGKWNVVNKEFDDIKVAEKW